MFYVACIFRLLHLRSSFIYFAHLSFLISRNLLLPPFFSHPQLLSSFFYFVYIFSIATLFSVIRYFFVCFFSRYSFSSSFSYSSDASFFPSGSSFFISFSLSQVIRAPSSSRPLILFLTICQTALLILLASPAGGRTRLFKMSRCCWFSWACFWESSRLTKPH